LNIEITLDYSIVYQPALLKYNSIDNEAVAPRYKRSASPMPIYEYACPRCRKIFSFLVRNISRKKKFKCPQCGSSALKRIYSSFATVQSEESRLEKMADPSFFSGLDENDPRSLARLMKKMARETGEEMDDEMKEICERLEAGEDPEKLEAEMGGGGPGGYTRDTSGRLYE